MLQDLFLAHLLQENLDPSSSLDSDWEKWVKEVKEREKKYISWLNGVRSAMSSQKAETLQIQKFTEKFKSSLNEFNYLFDNDPILKTLRSTWIPQVDTRFNLKYDLQLELEELSEKQAQRSRFDPTNDETDKQAIEIEQTNHEENVRKWSETLLEFLEKQVMKTATTPEMKERRNSLIEEIKLVLSGLTHLNKILISIANDLNVFSSLKLKLWQSTQEHIQKLDEIKEVKLVPEPKGFEKEKKLQAKIIQWEAEHRSLLETLSKERESERDKEKEKQIQEEEPENGGDPELEPDDEREVAANINLVFDRYFIRVLKERIRTQVSLYKLQKTAWISNLRLLLFAIVSLFMESKLKGMTATAYSSGFEYNYRKQQELQKLAQLQVELEEADLKFREEKDKIKRDAETALNQFKLAMEEFTKLLEKSREQARKGLEEITILRGLNDSKKWKWTKTTPAQDFALKLVETLAGDRGDASAYRLKKVSMENASPDPMCLAKFSDNPEENKYTPRPYQVMLGLLGDADIDVKALFLLHKMGSGKSLTFSEILVKYILTADIKKNNCARSCLILAPQIPNMTTWAGELLNIRFKKEDIQERYEIISSDGPGVVSIILNDKTKIQHPFLIFITVFSKHLKQSSKFVLATLKKTDQLKEWKNLEQLILQYQSKSKLKRTELVKSFYANGVDQIYPDGKPDLTWFKPWEVYPQSKDDFMVPQNGIICIDEIQNMVNPKDWVKPVQDVAMTWAFTVALTGGRKIALTGTPALDFSRPLDVIKAFNILTQENIFPGGVWIKPMPKPERIEKWEEEENMANTETKFLSNHILKKSQEWSTTYYTKLLISYVDLDADPTTYGRVRNTCSFPELANLPPLDQSEPEKCEELFTVDNKLNVTKLGNSLTSQKFVYNFFPKGGLDATRVLIYRKSGKGSGAKSKAKNAPVQAKFMVIQEIINSLPNEKHFVFLNARMYADGTQHTLKPLIEKGLWKIKPYTLTEAKNWLFSIWNKTSFWSSREQEFQILQNKLQDSEQKSKLSEDELKQIRRKLTMGKEPTSTLSLADIWYEQHKTEGQTSKRLLPLTYLQDTKTEREIFISLHSELKKFKSRVQSKKGKQKSSEEEEEGEPASIARAFLFNFFISLWNHPENDKGSYFSTLLGDIQTKEGLSFLTTRCVHFVKVPTTRSMWLQVLARLLRLCSMTRAYPEIRDWVVKVYVYLWAEDQSQFQSKGKGKSSEDIKAFEELQKVELSPDGKTVQAKKSEIESLLEILQRNAIDCTFFAEYNFGLSADSEQDRKKLETLCRLPYHKAQEELRLAMAKKRTKVIQLIQCSSDGRWILETPDRKWIDIETIETGSFLQSLCEDRIYLSKNLPLYSQADELLMQMLTHWLAFTKIESWKEKDGIVSAERKERRNKWIDIAYGTVDSGERKERRDRFIEIVIAQKAKLISEGVITKENSQKILQGLLLTTDTQVDTLWSQINQLLVEDQAKLLKFLIKKRQISTQYELVEPGELEIYEKVATSSLETLLKKFDVLDKYEIAKRQIRKVPVQPSGGTPETGVVQKTPAWEYIPTENLPGKQGSSELASIFPGE
jgi:hypothetical protein